MKKFVATLILAIVFSLAVTANPSLHKYFLDIFDWKKDKTKTVEVKVYDQEGKLDYTLSNASRIYIDETDGYLHIILEYGEYGFTLDSWMREGAFSALRTRDGQTICIADWGYFWYNKKTVKGTGSYDF